MGKVQLGPLCAVLCAALGGTAGLVVLHAFVPLSPLGWAFGLACLVATNMLLGRGLRRRRATRFGWANGVTATRATLVALVTALVATSFTASVPVAAIVGLTVPALALDAVDGWVARRTGTASELGARFDMEVDAFLILVLSGYVAPMLGWWVLAIGVMRYAYVAAGWVLPWLRRPVPPRYWRKVVAAYTGIALAFAATTLGPSWLAFGAVALALALLVESFGRDVVWQARTAREPTRVPAGESRTPRHPSRHADTPGVS